jgi:hypothetical protein
MGRKSRDAYEHALGLRETETSAAETFAAEFPRVTGRSVVILIEGESPDRVMLIDGIETGVELTAIHAGGAGDIIDELLRLARQKHETYERNGIFDKGPVMLLGGLDWPAPHVEGLALYDVREELAELVLPSDFAELGFNEIWLMDDGPKYTSRHDPRAPADFFCFAPADSIGFRERERKRRPYRDLLTSSLI